MEKFHTLLVDPDPGNRNKLSSLCAEIVHFGDFYFDRTLEQGLSRLNGGDAINVIFLSVDYEKDLLMSFLEEAKQTEQGGGCAMIAISFSKAQDQVENLLYEMKGFHGLLCSPFSIDALLELTKIAIEKKKELAELRARKFLESLLDGVRVQLRVVSRLKSFGYDTKSYQQQMQKAAEPILKLSEPQQKKFLDVMIGVLKESTPPAPLPKKLSYRGASARLRKKVESEIVEELTGVSETQKESSE